MNPLASVGTGELILILVIALIFLGPERLPEIARSVGKTIRQFRDALQGMSSEFGEELASVQEVTRDIQEGLQAVQDVRNLPQTLVSTASAPLVKAMDPVKSAVKEVKEAVQVTSEPAVAQADDSAPDETETLAELESVTEPEEGDPGSPDEPRAAIEDEQV
jgi:sec-independent protein translocase protein TatB